MWRSSKKSRMAWRAARGLRDRGQRLCGGGRRGARGNSRAHDHGRPGDGTHQFAQALTIFLRHVCEGDSHAEVRVGHAHLAGCLNPEAVGLELQAQHNADRISGGRLYVASVKTDVGKRRPDRHAGRDFADVGAALAAVSRTSALVDAAGRICAAGSSGQANAALNSALGARAPAQRPRREVRRIASRRLDKPRRHLLHQPWQ